MKIPLLVITAALIAGYAIGQSEKLPDESTALLKKLRDWELEKQIELKAEIQEKRDSVVALLQEHLDAATKRGDLDGAIAIRKEIEKLAQGKSEEADSGPPDKTEGKWFVGTRWKVVREKLDTFELEILEGKVKASTDSRFFDYEISRTGSLTYQGLFREITLRFSNDKKSGTYRDDKGTKGTIELIEK